MKKYILIILVVFAVGTAKAQSGYGYKPFGVGFGVSYATAYTNVASASGRPSVDASLVYSFIPYFPVAVEFQAGQFAGGGLTSNLDPFLRKYTNNYKAVLIHEDLHMGAYLDYSSDKLLRIVKNFYGGTGFGFIFNSVTNQRTSLLPGNAGYVFPGSDKTTNFLVPIRVGYEFKIYSFYNAPNVTIDIGYTHNLVFNGQLDGYNDNFSGHTTTLQQYSQFNVGIKAFFGPTKLYNKLIRSYDRSE